MAIYWSVVIIPSFLESQAELPREVMVIIYLALISVASIQAALPSGVIAWITSLAVGFDVNVSPFLTVIGGSILVCSYVMAYFTIAKTDTDNA